jgi:uncharacterized membrane protein YtjA (UPF0391 family)
LLVEGREKEFVLYYTLCFLLIAFIAGFLGFGIVAGAAAILAKTLFFICMTLFLIGLLRQVTSRV